MNGAIAAGTFAVVAPAELPDKTFVSAIVLASKHRALPVWVGTASGLVVQAGIGSAAGRALALLPHRAVEAIVAGLFLAGAAYLLFVSERTVAEQGVALAGWVMRGDTAGGQSPSGVRVALWSFGVVTVAELGDLTQVIVANLAARTRDPWSVFAGAAVAFVVVSAIGVGVGRVLVRHVPLSLVRRLSGAVLLGLGIWSLVSAATA